MTTQSTHYIEDLTPAEIDRLTQLLSLAPLRSPSPNWLRDQTHCLSSFPPTLQKPSSFVPRLAMALPFTPPKAELCKTHKSLNSCLIRRIFLQVSAESTIRLTRLVENPFLSEELDDFVKRMHTINSLWMSAESYRGAFSAIPFDTRFNCIPSGCEACILASVGGNHRILSDLRASLLGRKRRGQPKAALFKLVEGWIDWTGKGDTIRAGSDALGKEIRHCRRQMQKARRQKRRNIEEGILDDEIGRGSETLVGDASDDEYLKIGDEKVEKDGRDFAGSIIDYYANLMSTTNLVPSAKAAEGMHPAFRKSVISDAATGTFQKTRKVSKTVYSESLYSTSDLCTSLQQTLTADLKGNTADDHALGYRILVGIEEEKEREEQQVERRRMTPRAAERMTRWSDFQ